MKIYIWILLTQNTYLTNKTITAIFLPQAKPENITKQNFYVSSEKFVNKKAEFILSSLEWNITIVGNSKTFQKNV